MDKQNTNSLFTIKETFQKSWFLLQKCFKKLLIIQAITFALVFLVSLSLGGISLGYLMGNSQPASSGAKKFIMPKSVLNPQAWVVKGVQKQRLAHQKPVPQNNSQRAEKMSRSFTPLILSTFIIFIVSTFFISTWGEAASITAIRERNNVVSLKDIIKQSIPKILPLALVNLLLSLSIFLGILFFIIPGIIFSIWFSMAPYALILEDQTPFQAFKRSRKLVQGFSWQIFLRILMLFLLTGALNILAQFIPFAGLVIPLIISMFSFIYLYVLYVDLRVVKKEI